MQTRNWLLWGGAKNLMGYNKAFLENTFVYVDYSPITSPAVRALGLSLGEDTPAMLAKYPRALSSQAGGGLASGNGYSSCASTIAPWASAELGLADQFRGNTCIASTENNFFDWVSAREAGRLSARASVGLRSSKWRPRSGNDCGCAATTTAVEWCARVWGCV